MIQNMGETQVLSTTAAVLAEGRLSTGADMSSRGTHACERGGRRRATTSCRMSPSGGARQGACARGRREDAEALARARADSTYVASAWQEGVSLQLDSARVLE